MAPGPDLALITRLVLNASLRAAGAAAVGMIAAGAAQAALGALGLAALLAARPGLFTAFRWVGAAVLLVWAFLALRAAFRPAPPQTTPVAAPAPTGTAAHSGAAAPAGAAAHSGGAAVLEGAAAGRPLGADGPPTGQAPTAPEAPPAARALPVAAEVPRVPEDLPVAADAPAGPVGAAGTGGGRQVRWAFAQGLLCTGSNPKVGMFLMAFLPQFVPPGVDPATGVAVLAVCYLAMGLIWLFVWMRLVHRLARYMHSARMIRITNGLTAAVFGVFAVRLALGG
ncbi:LysE family translocator [Streptomyces thermolilacinus]|nr:LysE family transporter [Streptomyces thermolilacinus]